MPTIFSFQRGNESKVRRDQEAPLLGRFRVLPHADGQQRRRSSGGRWFASFRRLSAGYDTIRDGGDTQGREDVQDVGLFSHFRRLLLSPEPEAVKHAIEHWWARASLLYVVPALFVCPRTCRRTEHW